MYMYKTKAENIRAIVTTLTCKNVVVVVVCSFNLEIPFVSMKFECL